MDKKSKIFVAGHRGLVGSAITRLLTSQGYSNVITRSREELDCMDTHAVADFFQQEKPEYVFLAAAKVGGLVANNTYPADFIYQNLVIQNNIIHHAYCAGVKKLLFLGSTCVYPRECLQPTKEEYLLTGVCEPTNGPYAVAKIAGITMCEAYNRQYGTDFLCAMPTNIYGPQDRYDLERAHVVPAMLRKFHEAKVHNKKEVVLWGTGTPLREFLYSDDLAHACMFLMQHDIRGNFLINVGTGRETSIKELAEMVRDSTGFAGDIVWDTSRPDGAPRRVLNVDRIHSLGWRHTISLEEGLPKAYEWFVKNFESVIT